MQRGDRFASGFFKKPDGILEFIFEATGGGRYDFKTFGFQSLGYFPGKRAGSLSDFGAAVVVVRAR